MIVCALACCFLVCPVPQDEPKAAYNSQKETISFPTADEALAKMELPASFKASVFASEPDLTQPIGFTTDERGRLWVVENNTYAERKLNFDTELRDRVVILEDSTGDGVADKHTVFWDEGVKATSVEVGFGGVYVLAPPKLMFIPDADRDDVPDGPPEILLDGFDHEVIRHNLANGLMWGAGWLVVRPTRNSSDFAGWQAWCNGVTADECDVWYLEVPSGSQRVSGCCVRRNESMGHGFQQAWRVLHDQYGHRTPVACCAWSLLPPHVWIAFQPIRL